MVLIFVSSQNSYFDILIPKVMVLGGRPFGRCLNRMSEAIINGISALKRGSRETSSLCSHSEKMHREPGSRPSLDSDYAGTAMLDFQASRL